ncbi:GNAT family N-acetyltransferase [Nocardia sp. CDC159]|uniref:GNAT family N-acetyltransferase n=1 Tax=Nocardia pulmonis TaxID=2951408 RepID=A0A9X2E824_9NOCA|nr:MULTISPECIES: GNAT family N-acetyltransferase [Nocardia]MCM6773416.1 GNAT family N-acetyltransferase [Nocardia pulmonis]MCM6786303.1 GNAT family N-acetyltransferase [Nocardia sp. CDC159]
MTTKPWVRRAEPSEAEEVARAFAAASVDEVVTAWILADQPDFAAAYREEYVPEMIATALRDDEVWIAGADDEIWTISVWQKVVGPDRLAADLQRARALFDSAPVQPARRLLALTNVMAETHPAEFPHSYLQVIVTLPQHRGAGGGAAIVTERAKAAADAGRPAYLEASTERSARLYARCGFTHTGALIHLPEGGPILRPMWCRG